MTANAVNIQQKLKGDHSDLHASECNYCIKSRYLILYNVAYSRWSEMGDADILFLVDRFLKSNQVDILHHNIIT